MGQVLLLELVEWLVLALLLARLFSRFGGISGTSFAVNICGPVTVEVFRVEVKSSGTGKLRGSITLAPVVLGTVQRVCLEPVFLAFISSDTAEDCENYE